MTEMMNDGKCKGKTALYFGSFDPVHVGHLIIAEYFLNYEEIRDVWFVLSPSNPFKTGMQQTAHTLRKEMLELAIMNYPEFRISDVEFDLPAPHYTYKTLEKLNELYPEKSFVLLIGSDNVLGFTRWKNYQDIISSIPVYVYPRPGFEIKNADLPYPFTIADSPLIGISSTLIRKNLAAGKAARFMLPDRVYRYIIEKKVYEMPNTFFSSTT